MIAGLRWSVHGEDETRAYTTRRLAGCRAGERIADRGERFDWPSLTAALKNTPLKLLHPSVRCPACS